MKKSIVRVLTTLALASLVVACAPQPTATPAPQPTATPAPQPTATPAPQPTATPAPVKLSIWHPYAGAMGKSFESLINDFNATHPNITVTPTYGGTLWTMRDKLLTAIAGGTPPDISVIDQFWSSELADAGSIVRMQDLLDADPAINKDDIIDQAWKTATYQGKIWSMPFSMSNEALYYNKDLFKKAGLEPARPPQTWAELVEMGKKLTQDLNGDGKTDQWGLSIVLKAAEGCVYDWLIFLWQNDGALFSDDFAKSRFNEPAGVETLQFYVDLVHKHKIVPLAPPDKGFENGLIAMTIASTARLNTYIRSVGTDKLGIAPLPKNKKQATGVGGANLAIFSATKNKQAAWEFVRWMSSADINLQWSMSIGYLPLRKSVINSAKYQEYLQKEPRAKVIVDQMPFAIVRPNIAAYAPGSREIGLAVEEAVFGNKDPKTTLDAAAKKVDALLQKKK